MLTLLSLALLLIAGALYALYSGLASLNLEELKAKAAKRHADATKVYQLRVRHHELQISLLLVQTVLAAIAIGILFSRFNGIVAVIVSAVFLTVARMLPQAYCHKHAFRLGVLLFPLLDRLLWLLKPIARPVARYIDKHTPNKLEHWLFSRSQLLKLFDTYHIAADSDIAQDELDIIKHVLQFGDKTIASVMTPRRAVRAVSAQDTVGPLLLDELHKSGFSRFPVYDGGNKKDEVVGTLYLRDLLRVRDGKKVADVMDDKVYYVKSQAPLDHALNAFLKTSHHLFIVVDEFEEVVGVITIEDVIEQILGKTITDEFDQYEDMRAVAALEAAKLHRSAKPVE